MSSWITSSQTTVTTDPADGSTETVTVLTFIPPTPLYPTSTWYIDPSETVEVYTTWVSNLPTPVTTTVTAETGSQSTSSSDTPSSADTTSVTTSPELTETASISDQTTTPTSTTTPIPSSTRSPKVESSTSDNGISNGALAGAVVGSVIGSALLTFLLAFLFFRRRRTESTASGQHETGPGSQSPTKSGAIIGTDALPSEKANSSSFSLATIVPHPADDETVRRRILTLIDQASLHVENYYASSLQDHLSEDAIARLAKYNTEFLPASAIPALGRNGMQRQLITHTLVYTLLQAIHPGGQLLPKLLAAQPQPGPSTTPVTETAIFTWRMLTAYIYNQSSSTKAEAHNTAREQASQSLATDFTTAFSPYALPSFPESSRIFHFTKLANATAELGIWLFAQPCTFEFVWSSVETEITVLPGVVKTCDEQGKRLATPQVLVEGTQVKTATSFGFGSPL